MRIAFHFAIGCFIALASVAFAKNPLRPEDEEVPTAGADENAMGRDRLRAEARQFADRKDWEGAIRYARAALEFQRQHFGNERPETCEILAAIASYQENQGDFAGTLATWRELDDITAKAFSLRHWRVLDARINVKIFEQMAMLPAADQQRLGAAKTLELESLDLSDAGNPVAALAKEKQVVDVRTELLGRENPLTAMALTNIGTYYMNAGNYAEAKSPLEDSVAIQRRICGELHPRTLTALNNLATYYSASDDFKGAGPILQKLAESYAVAFGSKHPLAIKARAQLGTFYLAQEDLAQAEPILLAVLRDERSVFGEEQFNVALSLERLGALYAKKGDYVQAIDLLQQSLALYRKVVGDSHPSTADALTMLGIVQMEMGDYSHAESQLAEVIAIRRRAMGDNHPDLAVALNNLAHLYELRGDLAPAERLYRQAIEIDLHTIGPEKVQTAAHLANLGSVYLNMRDFGKAEMYMQQAVDIYRRVFGDAHQHTAKSVSLLASVYKSFGEFDRAETMYKQSLASAKLALGEDHPEIAIYLNNLANLYEEQRRYPEAESLYRESLLKTESKFGEGHPATATMLGNLARTELCESNYQESAILANRTIDLISRTLSDHHPMLTEALTTAGTAQFALGDISRAENCLRRALSVAQAQMDETAAVQSERQQITLSMGLRKTLDRYLSIPSDASAETAYSHVLAWKGAVLARQIYNRRGRAADSVPLAAELQQVCTQLATLSLRVPEPSVRQAWLKQIKELKVRRETIEAELAYQNREFATKRKSAAVTPEQFRNALPAGTALVDLLEFECLTFPRRNSNESEKPHSETQLLAFIVRRDQPIARIDLGPAEPIDMAVEQWRNSKGFAKQGKNDPAQTLADLVWQPLAKHLDGCRTVLISPDGGLSRIPLGVLPGSKPGSYLIEDLAIGIIAVPQMLPEMMAAACGSEGSGEVAGSLLAVGDVDYDAAPGGDTRDHPNQPSKNQLGGGELVTFEALKSTGAEVGALTDLFQKCRAGSRVRVLEKAAATEAAFRQDSPQCGWLHIATHGFFAPPGVGSALSVQDELQGRPTRSGYFCGFLSGVALAGANRQGTGEGDDGILTASEVSTLDLRNVELAVLSGCETGLGQIAGGEGTLGLQRAFEMAGAKTTVASLWNVPDKKTSLLMQRFYRNLWERKLPKLEALREAQLWMLRTGGKAEGEVTAADRQPPYYWAAFVLSGDWR